MATLAQLETALVNADKAGDAEAARALAGEIVRLRGSADTPKPDALPPTQDTGLMGEVGNGAKWGLKHQANILPGLIRGAGSIGSTLLRINDAFPVTPIGQAKKIIEYGGIPNIVDSWEKSRGPDQERRRAMSEGLRNLGADPDSLGFQLGKTGAEIIGTSGAGGLLSKVVQSFSQAPKALQLAKALETGGMMTGAKPVGFLPQVANMGTRMLGGAGTGAAMAGMVDPEQAATGARIGAAIPPVLFGVGGVLKTAGRGASALLEPFTNAGREKIAGRALNKAAGGEADAVISALETATGNTPGFTPSVAQAANNSGISAFERTMRAIEPSAFNTLDKSQKIALLDSLQKIAKTPEERSIAAAIRNEKAGELYRQAFEADAARRLATEQAQKAIPQTNHGLMVPSNAVQPPAVDLATPVLRDLQSRPLFRQAVNQARELAANRGVLIADPLQSLAGLHYVKLALDDMAKPSALTPIGKNTYSAINDIRTQLSGELANISPGYGQARQTFAELSKPINQMDVGQALYERFVPALADNAAVPFKTRADAFANALRNGDELVRNVTGQKAATMQGTMTPEQIAALQGVAKDSQMKAAAEMGGRGVGSDTVQKIAMSNLADRIGVPNWLTNTKAGGVISRAGDILYGGTDDQIREIMARILTNPQEAARAMKAAKAGFPMSPTLENAARLPYMAAPVISAQ